MDFSGACIIRMSDDGWDVCIETNTTVNNAPWKYILSLDGLSEWAETVRAASSSLHVRNTKCSVLCTVSVVIYSTKLRVIRTKGRLE